MPFTENVTVDEGVNNNGVRTQLHFEGNSLIVQRTYDAEPHLQYAKMARDSTDGQRWGNGRYVGHIPPAEYAKILMLPSREERRKAVARFLQSNPALSMFHRALVVPTMYRTRPAAPAIDPAPAVLAPPAGDAA